MLLAAPVNGSRPSVGNTASVVGGWVVFNKV